MQCSLLALIRTRARLNPSPSARENRNFRSRSTGCRIALGEWRFDRYADDAGDSQFGKKGMGMARIIAALF
jgi:hypothetical protein